MQSLPAAKLFKTSTGKKKTPVWCKRCGRKHSRADACEVYQVPGAKVHEVYGALRWSVIPQKGKSDA